MNKYSSRKNKKEKKTVSEAERQKIKTIVEQKLEVQNYLRGSKDTFKGCEVKQERKVFPLSLPIYVLKIMILIATHSIASQLEK